MVTSACSFHLLKQLLPLASSNILGFVLPRCQFRLRLFRFFEVMVFFLNISFSLLIFHTSYLRLTFSQLDTNDHLHLGCLPFGRRCHLLSFSLFNKISSIAATKRAPVNSASGIISTAPTFTKLCAFSFDDHS